MGPSVRTAAGGQPNFLPFPKLTKPATEAHLGPLTAQSVRLPPPPPHHHSQRRGGPVVSRSPLQQGEPDGHGKLAEGPPPELARPQREGHSTLPLEVGGGGGHLPPSLQGEGLVKTEPSVGCASSEVNGGLRGDSEGHLEVQGSSTVARLRGGEGEWGDMPAESRKRRATKKSREEEGTRGRGEQG